MPALTHASSVNGNAEVIVEVTPAISLAITGNNDSTTGHGPFFGSDPSGIYPTPSGYGNNTSSSKVTMSPNQLIEGGDTAGAEGAAGFNSQLTVSTNSTSGYTITVNAATANDVNLVGSDNASHVIGSIETAGNLTAGDGKWGLQAAGDYGGTLTTNSWSPVPAPATPANVRVSGASATGYNGQLSVVKYGVATSANQAVDTYSATLTYTAATANS